MFVRPEVVDRHFAWSPGRALRLARRGKLPHHVLPDGSIRFQINDVEAQVERRGFDESVAQIVVTEVEVSE